MQLSTRPVGDITHKPEQTTANWSRCKDSDKRTYTSVTKARLSNIHLPVDALICGDIHCTDAQHNRALDTMYTAVCDTLLKAGLDCAPSTACSQSSHHIVPGWSEYVEESHTEARYCYITWRNSGKPRQGSTFDHMKLSRSRFKYALRQCQAQEDIARADALANSMTNKDTLFLEVH